MKPPVHVRDLKIGAVLWDGPRRRYKILKKSPGTVTVEIHEEVTVKDDTVMPPVETTTTRTRVVGIAPTARLADFRPRGTEVASEEK